MTPAADGTMLRLEAVTKEFVTDWRGRRWRALDAVSLRLARGEIGAVIGPNGSGKSTLLKLAAGLLVPTAGRCERAPGALGYLPEHGALSESWEAAAWLVALARIQGLDATTARAEAERGLARVGLAAAAGRRIGALSKGQRQRLALAQALLGSPAILLLDEPAAGLDPHGVELLAQLLREERARGAAVLVTTHFLPRLERDCDHVILLAGGGVRFQGPAAALAARGGAEAVYLAEVPA